MESKLFRKKSLDRITSPEQLNDYIRVTNPGVWLLMFAVIFLLLGLCVWGIFGKLDTTLSVCGITQKKDTFCYVKEADRDQIQQGMQVRIEDETYTITKIALQPIQVSPDTFVEYLAHVGNLAAGEWVYEIKLNRMYGEDGSIFNADIIIETVAPMYFVLN